MTMTTMMKMMASGTMEETKTQDLVVAYLQPREY